MWPLWFWPPSQKIVPARLLLYTEECTSLRHTIILYTTSIYNNNIVFFSSKRTTATSKRKHKEHYIFRVYALLEQSEKITLLTSSRQKSGLVRVGVFIVTFFVTYLDRKFTHWYCNSWTFTEKYSLTSSEQRKIHWHNSLTFHISITLCSPLNLDAIIMVRLR